MAEQGGEYEKLMERVLARFPELSREEVEALVESKLRESNLLNKVGALLLVAEELGAFKEPREEARGQRAYTRIGDLVPGLNDVSIRGVIYAIDKLIEVRDHKLMRLKIGDRSGSINVILWDERAEEASKLGLKIGDLAAVIHGYTRERIETGEPEIHVGRNGMLMKLEPEPGAPKPESYFMNLGEALERGRGVYDIKATVLEIGAERKVMTRFGEATLREILLIDDESEARLTVWREKAEELGDLKPGETIYLTDVRVEDGRLSLTPRSIIAFREKPSPEALEKVAGRRIKEMVLKVLDVIETTAGLRIISTDGERIVRVIVPEKLNIKSGDHILVKEATQEVRRDRVRLLCKAGAVEVIKPEKEIEPPNRLIHLREIVSGEKVDERDVIIEGILYTKTQPMSIKTRFGEAKKLGFWIKEGEAAVQGVAWRDKAEELDKISEGSRIRLKWVDVRMNIFDEPEINLGSDTVIEVLKSSQEELR
ncbi:MAG TPA: hypothetical protein ENF33_02430 [Nitrososphaeria archaeon]|nr:hypothetical protein [Nitrososphaeria archaeon]